MEVLTYPGVLMGYRTWDLCGDNLISLFGQEVWSPTNTATCRENKHHSPNLDCTCGFYAYYGLQDAQQECSLRRSPVLGLIAACGDICLHDTGFRAEKTQIIALASVHIDKEVWTNTKPKDAASYYQVPFVKASELPRMAASLGNTLNNQVTIK